VLDQGKLSEYTNWKQKLDLHMDPIDLRIASVREARNAERRFCFEIVTPQFTRVYQATSEEDMKSWIYTINNALQSAVEGKGSSGPVALDSPSGSVRKDFASALTGKSASQGHRSSYIGNKMVGRHATVGERPQRLQDPNNENSQKLLLRLREAEPANRSCADCNSETKVDWVSINIGAIICIECSGIHRSLGTHVTKVRSLTLDPSTFTPDVIEMLLQLGNRVTNSIWEARLEGSGQQKPTPQSSREQRLRFITAKYADRAFVRPLSAMTNSHLASADETLLASVKRNDVQAVGHALALGGNPNVVDRSRGTHAVFLALVAADPPAPSGSPYGSPTLSSSSNSPPRSAPAATGAAPGSSGSSSSSGPSRKSFPIAELLLLNGADLPPLPAPVPLSRAGRDYMEGKLEARGGGRRPTNASSTAPGMAPPSRGGGGPSSAGLPSPAISSAGPAPSTTAATTVTMVGSAPAATALSPGLVSRQADGKTASPGLPPHHHRNNSYHQHQSLNFQQPAPPQQHHQPPGLDEGGVGVGGDTLTALPAISPGAERRKRLSSGTRLVKQQAPGSLG
jgi:Arf-GAP/SH3 domain/ANK repeat/PH domain-containing protein